MFEYIIKCEVNGEQKLVSVSAENIDRALICLHNKYSNNTTHNFSELLSDLSTPSKITIFNELNDNISISDVFISLIKLFASDMTVIQDEGSSHIW